MFTTGSKWFFGLGALALALAAAYGWATGGSGLGPLTGGYHGGVGDHLGYTVLVSIGVSSIVLGVLAVAVRDADPLAQAQLAGTDTVPPASPVRGSHWPVVAAFGAALVALGLVISNVLFVIGLVVLLAVLVEWMVLAWSDRATGDPEANRLVRDRIMSPFEVPIAGFLIAGGTVVAFSRLLLTSSAMGAVWVATALGIVILAIGAVIATRPRLSPNLVAGVLVVCALGVVTAGVVSAARGERLIEPHAEDHGHEGDGGGDLEPYFPEGTNQDDAGVVTEEEE